MVKTWIQPIIFAPKELSMGIFLRDQEKSAHHVFEISYSYIIVPKCGFAALVESPLSHIFSFYCVSVCLSVCPTRFLHDQEAESKKFSQRTIFYRNQPRFPARGNCLYSHSG